MQDRFKFRIWDKKLKKIAKWGDNPYHNMEIMNYICVENPVTDWRHEDYILMQCTGLKDKNGILIFEGDILKYTSKPTNTQKNNPEYKPYNENYSVVWEDFYTGYNLRSKEKVNCFNLGIMTNDCEVIGNIYENPELIGGVK